MGKGMGSAHGGACARWWLDNQQLATELVALRAMLGGLNDDMRRAEGK